MQLKNTLQTIANGAVKTAKDIAWLGSKSAKFYRKVTDPVKPTIDRVIDPLALFATSNAALSAGVYYFNNKLGKIEQVNNFLNSHSTLETGLKVAAYGLTYILANKNFIIPLSKKLIKRKTTPSWKNHLKTGAIVTTALGVFYYGGVKEDLNKFTKSFSKTNSITGFAKTLTNEKNRETLDKYFSGRKLEELVGDIFQYEVAPEESAKIEKEHERIKKRRADFPYDDKVSIDAQKLIGQGFFRTPEEFAYTARVGYFEGGFDKKAGNDKDIEKGLHGIYWTLYNRFIFDTNREEKGKLRKFSKKNHNLKDIMFHHRKKKSGSTTWEFTCVRDHPKYFHEHKGKKKWDMYANNKINIAVGNMNQSITNIAYKSLVDVLTGKVTDPTKGALFYQNPDYVDKFNTKEKWNKLGREKVKTINSHDFYRPKYLNSNWATQMGLEKSPKINKASLNDCDLEDTVQYNSKREKLFRYVVSNNDSYENTSDKLTKCFNNWDNNNADKFPRVTSENIRNFEGKLVTNKNFPKSGKKIYVAVGRKR